MKEVLITDIWTALVEYIPERQRKNAAVEYINALLDNGIKEHILEGLTGIDSHLDYALEAVIEGDEEEDDDDDY